MEAFPQDLQAEQAILGSILLDNDALAIAAGIVTPYDFVDPHHQKIFEAMLQLYIQGKVIDLFTLRNELERRRHYRQIGGATVLLALIDSVSTARYIKRYAEGVRKKAALRKLLQVLVSCIARCFAETEEIETLLDETQEQCRAIRALLPDSYDDEDEEDIMYG